MNNRRNKNHEEHENHERWLVSYADFITLLFAFFVVLYATSSANEKKQKEFENSVKKYLMGVSVGSNAQSGDQGARDQKKYDAVISSPINTLNKNPESVETTKQQIETFIEENLTKAEVTTYVLDVDADNTGARLILNSSAFFEDSSVLLKKSSLSFIKKVSQLIQSLESEVVIESHLSGKESIDKFPSLWELSASRSTLLTRVFNKTSGIRFDQLTPVGYADSRPKYSNSESLDKNARIELVFKDTELH